jgi:hypothetical protein
MRTDGQMDMTKLIVAFRNFANAPKEGEVFLVHGMKACRENKGISPLILHFRHFTAEMEAQYLLGRRLSGSQSRFGRFGEVGSILSL